MEKIKSHFDVFVALGDRRINASTLTPAAPDKIRFRASVKIRIDPSCFLNACRIKKVFLSAIGLQELELKKMNN